MSEVAPDKSGSFCKYGLIEGGDGKLYRVARGGFNERGRRLEDAMNRLSQSAKEGGDQETGYSAARELFVIALEPFYDEVRINALLEGGAFGWGDIAPLCRIITGDDIVETLSKKE